MYDIDSNCCHELRNTLSFLVFWEKHIKYWSRKAGVGIYVILVYVRFITIQQIND